MLCVAAPRFRGPPLSTSGNNPPSTDCSGYFYFNLNAFAAGQLGGSPAPALTTVGATIDCQFWARDPGFAPPNGAQLTNALEFEVGW